jgi:hypothetical protein
VPNFLQENVMTTTSNLELDAIRTCLHAIKGDVDDLQSALADDGGDVAEQLRDALDPVRWELDRVLRLVTALE